MSVREDRANERGGTRDQWDALLAGHDLEVADRDAELQDLRELHWWLQAHRAAQADPER